MDPGQRTVTRDFTKKRSIIEFTIDGDVFRCKKALDLPRLQRLVNEFRDGDKLKEDTAVDAISRIMALLLRRDSYAVFAHRYTPGDDVDIDAEDFEPIDAEQVMDIVRWVMEQYTGRPTKPSSTSSGGSETDDAGTSSTVGLSPEDSTSRDFLSPTPVTLLTTT